MKVTASFGVAQLEAGLPDPPAFVEKADQALYKAKESGRNRVVAAPRPALPMQQTPTRRFTRSA